MNLNDLYKKLSDIPIEEFPSSALSGLLHGYLSVYSMVRVNPWLEEVYGSQWMIHERIREIAGELADLVKDPSITLEERVGHVADLMETYLTYSDMDFLDIALDAAYGILFSEGSDKIILTCRTSEMCRMLCSCYYFMGEQRYAEVAKEIVTEQEYHVEINLGDLEKENIWGWYRAVEFYETTIGGEGKSNRLENINLLEDNRLARLITKEQDMNVVSLCFDLLATKEYINLK